MKVKKVVVIGCGLAGVAAAEAARANDRELQITVIDESSNAPYSRCGLPYVISGRVSPQDLRLKDRSFFESSSIRYISGRKVALIDRQKKRVILDNREGVEGEEYDKLIIATGSSKQIPNIPGSNKRGLYTLFTLEDAEEVKKAAKNSKSAIVVGSGPVAIIVSEQLAGMKVKTILVSENRLLEGILDSNVSLLVTSILEEQDIDVIAGKQVKNFVGFDRVQGIVLDGQVLTADIVLLTGYLQPSTQLARECGLKLSKSGRIVIDKRASTSDEDIFAAGDCSEIYSSILQEEIPLQQASLALRSGIVAGTNAAGGSITLSEVVSNISFRLDGVDVCSVGITEEEAEQRGIRAKSYESTEYQFASYYPGGKQLYSRLVVKEGGILIGAQLVGPSAAAWGNLLSMMISHSLPLSYLADLETSFSPLTQPYWPSPVIAAKSFEM
ncbi:MAG: FAD-dependent oxidoreductase [Conexivisphaerales archaeon]